MNVLELLGIGFVSFLGFALIWFLIYILKNDGVTSPSSDQIESEKEEYIIVPVYNDDGLLIGLRRTNSRYFGKDISECLNEVFLLKHAWEFEFFFFDEVLHGSAWELTFLMKGDKELKKLIIREDITWSPNKDKLFEIVDGYTMEVIDIYPSHGCSLWNQMKLSNDTEQSYSLWDTVYWVSKWIVCKFVINSIIQDKDWLTYYWNFDRWYIIWAPYGFKKIFYNKNDALVYASMNIPVMGEWESYISLN